MSSLPGYTNTVVCPYNKSHVILRERFQIHLIKCKRANPQIKLEVCPFDQTHHVPDLESHVGNCPSRAIFDLHVHNVNGSSRSEPAQSQSAISNSNSSRSNNRHPTNADDEDWDDDNYGTYDPQQYVQSANVLRTTGLSTKSERRQFRADERMRLGGLDRKN